MSRDAVAGQIAEILRDELLLGSERSIPADEPLGELGVGLDSLALVNLLTAVEATFGVDLPDDIWTARGPLSLNELVDVVASTSKAGARKSPPDRATPQFHGPLERVELALGRRGLAGRAAWAGVRFAAPAARFVFSTGRHYLLERRLDDAAPPSFAPPPGIDLRSYEPEDHVRLSGFWAPFHERRSRLVFERSLRQGAIALVAVEGSRIVALDLLTATGNDEVDVDRPDACYAFALTEARRARGRGIGLALIAYSFRIARERGFRAQLTHVWEGNAPMLAVTTQLLGFRPIGTARRMHILGLTRWSWELGGMPGSGRHLRL